MRITMMVLLGIVSVLMIVCVMLQSSNGEGLSSTIAGAGASSAYNKKSKGYEKILNKATIGLGVVFVILTLILLVIE